MDRAQKEKYCEQIKALSYQLVKVLSEYDHPSVIGCALADVVSTHMVGFNPEIRSAVFKNWVDMTMELIPVNDSMYGDAWKDIDRTVN